MPHVADELKPAYLLTGSDRPKVDRALRRLRDRFESESIDLLNASETTGADAVAACNSLGLFGGERLVIVEETERWKADDAKAIAAYAADPAPGAVLGLVAGELRKDSTLKKAIAKSGEVLVYDVDRKKIVDWVVQQFAANGVKVDRDFARSVVEAVVPEGLEPDLHHLANEVAKLSTWGGGEPLEWEAVRELLVPFGEMPSFALTDAWGRRDVVAVLAAAEARPEHIVRFTWFITDRGAYVRDRDAIGAAYRAVIGRHFPAMSVIVVSGLIEPGAEIEIEATAVVPTASGPTNSTGA